MALMTADWSPLGDDVYYRKQELYTMGWMGQVDLSKFLVAAAPYGGPIALIRDDKLAQIPAGIKPIIYLYTSSGEQMVSIRWNSGRVIALSWSSAEDLLCIQDDGVILVYNIFGNFKKTFSMGQEVKDTKVLEVKMFQSYTGVGVAVLTGSYRIFVVNNVDDPRVRKLAEVPGLTAPPSSWVIINQDRQSRALVAKEAELYLVDHGGQSQQQNPSIGASVNAIIEMAVSANNKYLALFADTGLLWIGSTDLQKVYCEFDTQCQMRPKQLVWCGTGAVVGYWENLLLMVGPAKNWINYTLESHVHMVQEIDGVRIIGNYVHEFLQKVPGVTEDIFKIGSMAPGAMLYEASKEFQRGSQRADEYIRMIKDKLDLAVEQCIEAAGHELEPANQKGLLRAASFGKHFLTDYRPDTFVNMCQMLRVLHSVRDYKVGIPLTYNQLQHLSIPILIDRLVLRRQFLLAIKICQYLRMPETEGASRILAHWACYKVQQTDVDDERVAYTIAQKLGDTPGVSYSEIANKALECGRTELAIRLLEYEPRAAEQVPLLMKMQRESLALEKAIESGDTDLVYTVLLRMKETMPTGEFLMAIRSQQTASALYLQYCRQQNRQMLRDLYYQEDNFMEDGNCRIVESYEEDRMEARLSSLTAAQDAFNKARNEWAAKQTEEQIKLLRLQRRLEEETNKQFIDLTLQQTVYKLILENSNKPAEQMRKDFKIPDRRFWWIKLQALAEAGDWAELDRFSKSKKSPIGYEPFVEECIKYSNHHEAQKYLPKVLPENKVKFYVKAGQLAEAADIAFQQRSIDDLNYVASKCGNSSRPLVEKIQNMKTQLASKR